MGDYIEVKKRVLGDSESPVSTLQASVSQTIGIPEISDRLVQRQRSTGKWRPCDQGSGFLGDANAANNIGHA